MDSKDHLNNYFNASGLRLDSWSQLKKISKGLQDSIYHGEKKSEKILELKKLLGILNTIENYWAFPGQKIVQGFQAVLEDETFSVLYQEVDKIFSLLSTEGYRGKLIYRNSGAGAADKYDLTEIPVGNRRKSEVNQHYFEVLIVGDFKEDELNKVRARMQGMGSTDKKFTYNVIMVNTLEDALIGVLFNYNIQSVIIRSGFEIKSKNTLQILNQYIEGLDSSTFEHKSDLENSIFLGQSIKQLRPELDQFLITEAQIEQISSDTHEVFNRVFYRREDYLELHLSIQRGIEERYQTPFFNALTNYSKKPTGVFHAMPISRGNSIFQSHWVQDFAKFYGANLFLAETSATTGGLDSLLQPTGAIKKAQELCSKAFGSQRSYFATNGTSTSNKIVVQALIHPGDIVLVDRDCHKSHHYGMVLSGGCPVYLESFPLKEFSMYGAVSLSEILKKLNILKESGNLHRVKLLLLTNCTFDGVVYNVQKVMEEVLKIKPDMIFLWDEAWFAFALCTPTYRQRTGMFSAQKLEKKFRSPQYRKLWDDASNSEKIDMVDPDKVVIRVYSTQSTHKTLSALRQSSMIHIHDQHYRQKVEDAFHEAYMTHTSTSPNYSIIASLDMARRQVQFEGYELVQKSIEYAMSIREKIATIPLLNKYFRVLGPKDIIPDEFRESKMEYYFEPEKGWTTMENAWKNDEFALDPTRITLYTGQAGINGDDFKTKYLMDKYNIQVNKTSVNTVLFMINIGTTRSAIAYLISVLTKIAEELEIYQKDMTEVETNNFNDKVKLLTEDLPQLPDFSYFHNKYKDSKEDLYGEIRSAYFDAFHNDKCEYLKLDGTLSKALNSGRDLVSAGFIIPYPPGFPVLVPGQVITSGILDYIKKLDVKEIHGYRPEFGLRIFKADHLNLKQE